MKHPAVYVCHTLTMLSGRPRIQANDLVSKLTAAESNARLIGRAQERRRICTAAQL
jgi:hypothetical protein